MDTLALLTTGQAAQRLGVSVSYLNKLRLGEDGPPFVKLGARVAYRPQDLTAWIDARVQRSTSEPKSAVLFPDVAVRSAVVSARESSFAASYLDPAGWNPETRAITPRTEVARRKLLEPDLKAVLAGLSVTVDELVGGGNDGRA